ncbi:MAG: Uma2 family endonuclease [Jaaginema sp. PMC 1079.18]|nr:Uma2 family endonuclease [Jaaginema sp. PMC 1080.18]MEC4853075.1 Uma2 family endonuclease [Jaaginema sp. PMC 1079.18]MEC4865055.1 Uma2 family endonuclease [Jaaginema sp. PMC 1078.18]
MAKLTTPPIPFLENGDRLHRSEFEKRYHGMPKPVKAELIEGTVYMASPLRFSTHAEPHSKIITWLGVYTAATPGTRLGDNATIRLDGDNEPQPDALLRIEPEKGGKSFVSDDDYIEGSPELIVEIAASTASYDRNDKLHVYQRNGVQEYIVWSVYESQIEWFELEEGRYVLLNPDEKGMIHSRVFPGLSLSIAALIAGDLGTVLASLQQGLGTATHQAFIAQLRD